MVANPAADRARPFTLCTERIRVDVDPGRGADVLQITDVASGVGILAATPWRRRADSIRAGRMAPSAIDATDRWLEQYRGGWQTLCPNAGPPRRVGGTEVGFHGEASVSAWDVEANDEASARLSLELFSVPVRIDRELRVEEARLIQTDVLTNLSRDRIDIDYVSHPAFGGEFLDGRCVVATDARSVSLDPGEHDLPSAEWPRLPGGDDGSDLRVVPPPGVPARTFGWLSDFDAGWYAITNADRGLEVRVEWDARTLPHAWWWQELNGSPEHPWFGRARIMAIEPASTTTSGSGRAASLSLEPTAQTRIEISVALSTTANR
ncbi:DUF4432 family protein [Microbacterium hominis]|uniref:DUF4432 family protein n=1 Tax=Microbacterium hominis TaxID=162426 RepID=A0A7D4TPT2_9MICO|nr:DUF4432 family protein [Microbacterium hominis]QKJ18524.1 DUF4432 family protein [Microbacterium hominis]